MTHCCLVRHGQTDWNIEGRYTGQSDVPLNESGRQQAESLAALLATQHFAAVYTSDLSRARETAEIIAAPHKISVNVEPRLREINQGEWEGLHFNFIRAQYDDLWKQRFIDPAGVRPPGGETINEVAARIYTAMNDIALLHPDESVLIVSHGLALALIICKVQASPIARAYHLIPENTHPIWVDWDVSI
ncbi:MAG: histidine phosphatase family protein [Flexilinea sp.]